MLKRKETEQMQLELVTYDLLVRKDHLLGRLALFAGFAAFCWLLQPDMQKHIRGY